MKNRVLTILLALLVAFSALSAYFFYQLNQTVTQVAENIAAEIAETKKASVDEESGLLAFYTTLYTQLQTQGVEKEYEQQSTELLNTLLERTFKNYTIQDIDFESDAFIVTLSGVGASLNDINNELITRAATKAAGKYLRDNWAGLAGSVLTGSEEKLKAQLYQKLGPQIFEALDEQIASLPDENVTLTYSIRQDENGWQIRPVQDKPAGETQAG